MERPGAGPASNLPGDSNHDGVFNSADFVAVLAAGEYEDGIAGNSTFEEGDWDGDGDFTTSDLVFALQQGNYVAQGHRRWPAGPSTRIDLRGLAWRRIDADNADEQQKSGRCRGRSAHRSVGYAHRRRFPRLAVMAQTSRP